MNLTSTMIIKMDRDINKICKSFRNKSLKTITISHDGFCIPFDRLKITLNDKEIKLINTHKKSLHIGCINYNITDEYYSADNYVDSLCIEYNYINYNKENDKIQKEVKKFPNTYNSDCYVVLTYSVDINSNGDDLTLKNSLNREIINYYM